MRMTEIVYKDELVTDLRLHLIPGLVEKYHFSILKQDEILLDGLHIEAHIIGASHMIHYNIQGRQFTEVLSCSSGHTKFDENIYWGPTDKKEHNVNATLCDDLIYSSRINQADWEQKTEIHRSLEQVITLAVDRFNEIGLIFQFPRLDRWTPTPETLVWVHAPNHTSVDVRTVHSYPAERSLILSSTHVCLKGDTGQSEENGGGL